MNKAAISHHKPHKPPQCGTGAKPSVGLSAQRRPPGPVSADRVAGASGERCSRGSSCLSVRESLNWTLRRYVPALSLRVWLRRQAPETGCTVAQAGRGGPPCRPVSVGAVRVGTAGETGSRVPVGRAHGVSLSRGHTLRYRVHRNRQMEHFAQVEISLRGGVRRAASITARERVAASDLGSAT